MTQRSFDPAKAVVDSPGQVDTAPPVTAPPTPPGPVIVEPLWRTRLRLLWRGFRKGWSSFAENKVGVVGLGIILFFGLMALAHPILMNTAWSGQESIYDPVTGYDAPVIEKLVVADQDFTDRSTQITLSEARLLNFTFQVGDTFAEPLQPAPPSWATPTESNPLKHVLGTDPLGRDVLSQLMFSTRAAFVLGIVAALVTVIIATTIGSVSAYFGGWVDSFFMRLADLILLVPFLVILIVLSALWSFQLIHLALLIGILNGFGGTAIILKAQALSVKVKPFIDAAKVAGGSNIHVVFRHIVPNVMPLSFLYMMFTVTEAISAEATLSFLGLLNIPMSWGIMIQIANTQGYLLQGFDFWWLLIPAGVAVTLLAGAFFLVGRAMDEIINPRLRKR